MKRKKSVGRLFKIKDTTRGIERKVQDPHGSAALASDGGDSCEAGGVLQRVAQKLTDL